MCALLFSLKLREVVKRSLEVCRKEGEENEELDRMKVFAEYPTLMVLRGRCFYLSFLSV